MCRCGLSCGCGQTCGIDDAIGSDGSVWRLDVPFAIGSWREARDRSRIIDLSAVHSRSPPPEPSSENTGRCDRHPDYRDPPTPDTQRQAASASTHRCSAVLTKFNRCIFQILSSFFVI